MKKALIFIFLILNNLASYCQTDNKNDTIYVYFNSSKFQVKEAPAIANKYFEQRAVYKFFFNKEKTSFFQFNRSKYLDVDSVNTKDSADVKVLKKSFLKKNKDKIVDMDFFMKNGIENSFLYIAKSRTIYLIDKDEIKKGKITMYQVGVYSTYLPEI